MPRIRVNYSFVSTILQPRANYKHVECLKHATGRSYRVRLAMLLTHSLFLFASTRTPMRTENVIPSSSYGIFLPSLSFCRIAPTIRNESSRVSDRCRRTTTGTDERVALSAVSHIFRYITMAAPPYNPHGNAGAFETVEHPGRMNKAMVIRWCPFENVSYS